MFKVKIKNILLEDLFWKKLAGPFLKILFEVKNNLTMGRGEWEGTMRRGDYRNYYKGHMDKIKGEGRGEGGRGVQLGWGGGMGRKGTQL